MSHILALGADHGGFPLKTELVPWLQTQGHQVLDLGTHSLEPNDDYPDFTVAIARNVVSGQAERGILICGNGVDASIVANKVPRVRACLCHDIYSAHQGVEHDDINIICLGARIVGVELAKDLIAAFLNARFTGEERHRRRVAKVAAIEHQALEGRGVQTTGGVA